MSWPPELAARYRALGWWRGEPLDALLRRSARVHPERPALVGGDVRLTYAELDRRVDGLAAGFAGILAPGDHVVVQLPNVPAFVEVVLALLRLGALPVFALPAHRRSELTAFVAQTGARAVVTVDRHAGFDHQALALSLGVEHVVVAGEVAGAALALDALRAAPRELPAPDAGAVAFLQLSGGSTGTPKLIPRTHDDYAYSVRESAAICGLTPETVYLAALPVAHNFTMSSPGLLGVLHAGGCVVLAPNAAPDTAFALIEREGVTLTSLVPPLALAWLEAAPQSARDLASLRLLQVGGAKLPPAAARRIRPELGCALQQVFGMAEGLVCYTRLDDPEELVTGTQGRPISPEDEVRIVDEDDAPVPEGAAGNLLTRGPYTIRAYHLAPEHDRRAFTADGFYRTGDVVRRLASGHLVVEGRAKDQINRGGEKIAAQEVEDHLVAHPAVHDAALVAMPDPYLGERSCAWIVPAGAAPGHAGLLRFLRDRGVAAYKLPDRFEFVDHLPRTGVGKVSKRELRDRLLPQPAPRS